MVTVSDSCTLCRWATMFLLLHCIASACLDQLGIQKQSSNLFLTSCGQVDFGSVNFADLSTNSGLRPGGSNIPFLATFFSGRQCESSGFYLWVECIKSDIQNATGCFDPPSNLRKERETSNYFVS